MKDPALAQFEERLRELLAKARETLGAIEMHVREVGDVPALMAASRTYARFCMHVRDYLSGAQTGHPMPRRFAHRVLELRDELIPRSADLEGLGQGPSVQELTDLAGAAERLPGTA